MRHSGEGCAAITTNSLIKKKPRRGAKYSQHSPSDNQGRERNFAAVAVRLTPP